jgi:FixJ family two-component response regulator
MDASRRSLRCIVVEDDDAVRTAITLALRDFDVEAPEFASAGEVLQACERIAPDVVFLDVALRGFDAIDVVRALGSEGYRGAVQLVSGHHSLLDAVQRIGEGSGLTMLEPVRKPFYAREIRRAAEDYVRRTTAARDPGIDIRSCPDWMPPDPGA